MDKLLINERNWGNGFIPEKYTESFWSRIDKKSENECWNWTAYKVNNYGIFYYGAKGSQAAHRVSWYIHNGIIPDNLLVCHRCDNPSCVNPDHLFLGTYQDNTQDMIKKGRNDNGLPRPGEGNGNSKLTWKDVIEIKTLWMEENGRRGLQSQLSRDFGVDRNVIMGIIENRTWKEEEFIVNEIYDKLTFQGEGPSIGRVCTFIRLGGCGLRCTWCDAAFSWRFSDKFPHVSGIVYDKTKELTKMSTGAIIEKLKNFSQIPPLIVISGGEPMLQSKSLPNLILNLNSSFKQFLSRIEIETAGTIFDEKVASIPNVYFNVSPKLESSGNPKQLRYKPEVLKNYHYCNKAIFKFVICEKQDFDEIDEIVRDIGIPKSKIWIMVEGITKEIQEQRMREFAPFVLNRRWNYTPRLHIQIWGNQRGT